MAEKIDIEASREKGWKRSTIIGTISMALLSGFSPSAFSQREVPASSRPRVFEMNAVDEEPQFPGGEAAKNLYFCTHLRYPKEEAAKGIHGSVIVAFVLDTTGAIGKVHIERGIDGGPDLDVEAERVVSNMPHWIPGRNGGRPVPVRIVLGVLFGDERDPPPMIDDGSLGPVPTQLDGWITFTLNGRSLINRPSLPSPGEKCDVQMRIQVDIEGKVTAAEHFYASCSSKPISEKARALAMEMRFEAKTRGCAEDEGWLTLHFPGKP